MAGRTFRQLQRLWWIGVLLLAAIGGAGLTAEADAAHDSGARPELSWRADERARPWLDGLATRLAPVEQLAADLSAASSDLLVALQSLDAVAAAQALEAGDIAAHQAEAAETDLGRLDAEVAGVLAGEQLGHSSRERLALLGRAVVAAGTLPATWHGLATVRRGSATLAAALERHNQLLDQATDAGQANDFGAAVDLLAQARSALGDAGAARDQLANSVDGEATAALDEALAAYAAFDDALAALYTALLRPTPPAIIDQLMKAAQAAQAALPPDNQALGEVVAGAAGGVLDALADIEAARGDILAALSADEPTEADLPGENLAPDGETGG
jgi:hypothetical protein